MFIFDLYSAGHINNELHQMKKNNSIRNLDNFSGNSSTEFPCQRFPECLL